MKTYKKTPSYKSLKEKEKIAKERQKWNELTKILPFKLVTN
jgi:hypothetical protein